MAPALHVYCRVSKHYRKLFPINTHYIPYSRKYWRSLNLAVWPQTTFLAPLLELNLAVWYGIAIRTCTHKKKFLSDFDLAVLTHTVKPPNLIPRQIFRLYGIISDDRAFMQISLVELHGAGAAERK